VNTVQLIANLTADPELRETGSGPVANMRVAVQRPKRGGEDRGADYVDIAVWGPQATACAKYLVKGRRIAISGRLHHSEWETDEGAKRSRLGVVADNIEFLDAPRNGNGESQPDEPHAGEES
jgi:single-strand DNA-binding protein